MGSSTSSSAAHSRKLLHQPAAGSPTQPPNPCGSADIWRACGEQPAQPGDPVQLGSRPCRQSTAETCSAPSGATGGSSSLRLCRWPATNGRSGQLSKARKHAPGVSPEAITDHMQRLLGSAPERAAEGPESATNPRHGERSGSAARAMCYLEGPTWLEYLVVSGLRARCFLGTASPLEPEVNVLAVANVVVPLCATCLSAHGSALQRIQIRQWRLNGSRSCASTTYTRSVSQPVVHAPCFRCSA